MQVVFELVFFGAMFVAMAAFIVFMIRRSPAKRGGRDLDRSTEMGNAEIRAWTDRVGGSGSM